MINRMTDQEIVEYGIPVHTASALRCYVEQRIPSGDFLTAVLTNNLKEAIFHADGGNIKALKEIVMFCYWHIPSSCWGSEEKVQSWLEGND